MLIIKNERGDEEMRKRILWLGLSFLLVAALVLSSCGKAEPGEQEEEEEEEEEEGAPQYGGTLNILHAYSSMAIGSWDPADGDIGASIFSAPFGEHVIDGGVEQYGPRGTGELSFTGTDFPPSEYCVGELAESWEITADPMGLIYHIRPGVMFPADEDVGMESREYTAYDAEYCFNRIWEGPRRGDHIFFVEDFYAKDKYTFVLEFNQFYADWTWRVGYSYLEAQYAREGVEAPGGLEDWKNWVGTGPFMLTDYVKDSHVTCTKNPVYWGTTNIDGQDYPLPFVDEFTQPLIADESTRIAAIRTGQVDLFTDVPVTYQDSLEASTPDLIGHKYLNAQLYIVALKCNSQYFSDRDIRRAMMVGTDLEAFVDLIYMGDGEIDGFVFNSSSSPLVNPPRSEWPESTSMLYEYDPDAARQMISDAGYPDGFSIELVASSDAMYQDIGSLLKAQWGKIGVEADLLVLEPTLHANIVSNHEYNDAYLSSTGSASSFFTGWLLIGLTRPLPDMNWYNYAEYDDPYFNEGFLELEQETDFDKFAAGLRDLTLYMKDDVPYIPLGAGYSLAYNWPWVKNYYGETIVSWAKAGPLYSRIWIDEDLKESMGY